MRPLITVAPALKRPCAMAGCASQTSDNVSKRSTELCTRKNHHGRHTRTSDRQPPRLQLPRGAQTSDATPAIPSEVGRTIRQACMLLRLRFWGVWLAHSWEFLSPARCRVEEFCGSLQVSNQNLGRNHGRRCRGDACDICFDVVRSSRSKLLPKQGR